MEQQPNPWRDFFGAYLDLGYALQAELARDVSLADKSAQLQGLLQRIRDEQDPAQSEFCRGIVHEVIMRFRNKSKQILLQDSSYFDEQLLLFPTIDLDVAALWRDRPLYRNGLWKWIEQLYVIGNVCLHPNRKDKFLKAVKELKASARGVATASPEAEEEQEQGPQDMDAVIDTMAGMFGMDQNPAMKRMMAKMAKSLHGSMSQAEDPMALVQQLVSGDMSMLGDLQGEMEKDITKSIESGELTEADFVRSREGMMNKFGGMSGLMQMAQGMGIQVPGGAVEPPQPQPPHPPQRQQPDASNRVSKQQKAEKKKSEHKKITTKNAKK